MRNSTFRRLAFFWLVLNVSLYGDSVLKLKDGDRIVALGDSITLDGGYLAFMMKVLNRRYPSLKVEIINAGVSGNHATDMWARLQRDVIDKKPTVVTISCGVNDVWHLFYDPVHGVDLPTYSNLITQMVDKIRASTQANVYLLTPSLLKEDLRSRENLKLEPYCETVRRIAKEKGCILVDVNQLLNLSLRAAQTGGAPNFHPTSDGIHMKPSGDFLMGASILRAMGVPLSAILEATYPLLPQFSAADPHLQFWGRWDMKDASTTGAVTVNTGSTIVAKFRGTRATLHFSVGYYSRQLPTLWLQLDDGKWRLVVMGEELDVSPAPLAEREHVVRAVVKGFSKWENRWEPPLDNSVVFRGLSLAAGEKLLDPPARPRILIEYLGDDATEGVLAHVESINSLHRTEYWPQWSDGRGTWAYQAP